MYIDKLLNIQVNSIIRACSCLWIFL